jgi:parallel beta-helix repeat protein
MKWRGLVDNLISNNTARESGGGFYLIESTAVLTHNRILSNTADLAGGLAWSDFILGGP